MDNFNHFYTNLSKFYSAFGIDSLFSKSPADGRRKLKTVVAAFNALLFLFPWAGIIATAVATKAPNDERISTISAWIQLLANSVAMSVCVLWNFRKLKGFQVTIIDQLVIIDDQLRAIGLAMNYRRSLNFYGGFMLAFLVFIVASFGYDGYHRVLNETRSISGLYWMLCILPMLFNSVHLSRGIVIVSCIGDRFARLNKALACSYDDRLKEIFRILNELQRLCEKVNRYLGCLFLVTIAANFAMTCTNVYQCVIIVSGFKEGKHNVSDLIVVLNSLILNVSLLIALTAACDRISSNWSDMSTTFATLLLKGDSATVDKFCHWMQSVEPFMRFSGAEFFDINYTLLCGYAFALVTYLVVLVQFNWSTSDKGDTFLESSD